MTSLRSSARSRGFMACWQCCSVCRLDCAARRFGEKRVLVLGLVGVAVGSVLLGQAQDFTSAISIPWHHDLRLPLCLRVRADCGRGDRAARHCAGRTMGVLGATSAMASVVGSPLGGLLVDGLRLAHCRAGLCRHGAAWRSRSSACSIAPRGRSRCRQRACRLPYSGPRSAALSARRRYGCWHWSSGLVALASSPSRISCPAWPSCGVWSGGQAQAGLILSTGYLAAILMNLLVVRTG